MKPPTIGHKDEFILDTIDLSDLLMQFKVMKALGYKSLFDPDFRRELRNPFRRFLYYKIIITEEGMEKKFSIQALKSVADRISFFNDPELYRKVKAQEEQRELLEPDIYNEKAIEAREKYKKDKQAYIPLTDKDKEDLGLSKVEEVEKIEKEK